MRTLKRAPGRTIPTDHRGVSIGLGALAALIVIAISIVLPKQILLAASLLSPFTCGFVAGLVFGSRPSGRITHILVLGVPTYLLFLTGLMGLAFVIGEAIVFIIHLGFVVLYFAPFLIVTPFILSAIGAALGKSVAGVVGR